MAQKSKATTKDRKAPGRKEPQIEFVHVGDIAIDTGTLILADPCRMNEVLGAIDHIGNGTACHRSGKLNMGIGVSVPTGLGDGIYPVVACYETVPGLGRFIVGINVDFTNPMRGHGCEKAFPHDAVDDCYYGSADRNSGQRLPEMLNKTVDGERLVLHRVDSTKGYGADLPIEGVAPKNSGVTPDAADV